MDDLEAEDAESETSPPDAILPTTPNNAPNGETTRHNRRSRILHIGRMRHATPDERIEALRRLRNENRDRATNANVEEGGLSVGERTLNRIGARLSRAFGGSRPASGVSAPGSRPVSQVPAVSETMEAPSPIAEVRRPTEEEPTTSPIAEAQPPHERNVTTIEPPAATTTETAAEPSAPEINTQ